MAISSNSLSPFWVNFGSVMILPWYSSPSSFETEELVLSSFDLTEKLGYPRIGGSGSENGNIAVHCTASLDWVSNKNHATFWRNNIFPTALFFVLISRWVLPVSYKMRQNGNFYLLAAKLEISKAALFLYKIYKDTNVWNLDLGKNLLQNQDFFEKDR